MLLVAVFVSVLVVPLGINILEIFLGRVASQDQVYLLCVLLSVAVSLLYTLYHKDRVNSDEVLFFARNRLIKQRRLFKRYLRLQALLITKVGPYNFKERIDFFKGQAPSQKVPQAKQDSTSYDCACNEALSFVEGLLDSVGAGEQARLRASNLYLEYLLSDRELSDELKYWHKRAQRCGPYLSQLLFVLLVRSLMSVEAWHKGYSNFQQLLNHPALKQVGAQLLGLPESAINESYYNRYFFLLQQESMRLKQAWFKSHYNESTSFFEDAKPYTKERAQGHFLSELDKAYITLGLRSDCSLEQLKRQYRKLAFKYHPDHISNYENFSVRQKQELTAQFLAIVQAYELIIQNRSHSA